MRAIKAATVGSTHWVQKAVICGLVPSSLSSKSFSALSVYYCALINTCFDSACAVHIELLVFKRYSAFSKSIPQVRCVSRKSWIQAHATSCDCTTRQRQLALYMYFTWLSIHFPRLYTREKVYIRPVYRLWEVGKLVKMSQWSLKALKKATASTASSEVEQHCSTSASNLQGPLAVADSTTSCPQTPVLFSLPWKLQTIISRCPAKLNARENCLPAEGIEL